MAGFDRKDYRISGLRYEDLRPRQLHRRRPHLRTWTSTASTPSVCYPGFGAALYVHPDPEVAAAGFRAYNDWILDDFQAEDPKRLCGLALAPIELGIDDAVGRDETRRREGLPRHVHPRHAEHALQSPTHYELLWQAANDHGVTLCMHRNHGGPPDKTDWDFYRGQGQHRRHRHALLLGVRPFSYLIFAGVFDRYPNLNIVGAEVDCGWAPFWVQTLGAPLGNPEELVPGEAQAQPDRLHRQEHLHDQRRRLLRLRPHQDRACTRSCPA